MPAIKLHQPIEGGNVGQTVEVPQARADFYVALGYAVYPDQEAPVAVPGADKDPTLAENREKPDDALPKSKGKQDAVEGTYDGTNDDHREAQAEADEASEETRERSAEVREKRGEDADVPTAVGDEVRQHPTGEDGTNTTHAEAQAEADEKSAEVDEVGDNALNQPDGREVPVTAPAEPAIPEVDPGVAEVADEGAPATKGTRKPKRKQD